MGLHLGSATQEYASRPAEERFGSWEAWLASLASRKAGSTVKQGPQAALRVVADGDAGMAVRVGSQEPVGLTHYGFGVLASLGGAPAGYLRTLPAPIAADALNASLTLAAPAYDDGKVKLLFRNGGTQLAAATSTQYGRIWDHDVATSLARLNDRLGGILHPAPTWDHNVSLYASDRDMFALLIDGGSVIEEPGGFGHRPSQLHRGVMIRNSETGHAALEMLLFWFRVVCGNLIIHDGSIFASVRIRHTLNAADRLAQSGIAHQVRQYLTADTGTERRLITRAMEYVLPPTIEARTDFLRDKGRLTKAEATHTLELARTEEGDNRTLWQVVQGATAVARTLPYAEDQTSLSRRATGMLRLAA